jgi:hypothetical protein
VSDLIGWGNSEVQWRQEAKWRLSTVRCWRASQPILTFGLANRIRGQRITVQEVLEWLSTGTSQDQILADYPQLKPEDLLAVHALPPNWRAPKPLKAETPLRQKPVATISQSSSRTIGRFREMTHVCSAKLTNGILRGDFERAG